MPPKYKVVQMNNHWLSSKNNKLFKQIDEIGLEVCDEVGTLGDLLDSLTKEQLDYFLKMQIRDFFADSDEQSFGLDIISP